MMAGGACCDLFGEIVCEDGILELDMPRIVMLMVVGGLMAGMLGGVLGGCATIRNEKHKDVRFTSEPGGAAVMIDDELLGTTPCMIEIPRKGRDKEIELSLYGYKTVMLNLDRKVEKKTMFGGLIGMSIDAISGKAGTYADHVHIVMEEGVGIVELDSGVLEKAQKEEKEEEMRQAAVDDLF